MAEYLIKGESLVAIADEVRGLSGKTEAMGVNAMADTLSTENSNFNTNLNAQDDLLAQIEAALEGKTAGTMGEDVTAETNAYTERITQLTTAVTALENELAGKASGGSGNIATSVVTITTGAGKPGLGAGEGTIYYTSSNGTWVEENISLMSNGPVTINMATNTIFITEATEMSDTCQVDGGQILSILGSFACVITEPTATIYLT